jgi:hypothetical protein
MLHGLKYNFSKVTTIPARCSTAKGGAGLQKICLDELFHALWARLQAGLLDKLGREQSKRRKEKVLEAQERASAKGYSSQGPNYGSFNGTFYDRRPQGGGLGGPRLSTGNTEILLGQRV